MVNNLRKLRSVFINNNDYLRILYSVDNINGCSRTGKR